jgi:hypothetical protein
VLFAVTRLGDAQVNSASLIIAEWGVNQEKAIQRPNQVPLSRNYAYPPVVRDEILFGGQAETLK